MIGNWRKLHNRGASWFVILKKCYSGYQIKESEIGKACGSYGDEEECVQGFGEVRE